MFTVIVEQAGEVNATVMKAAIAYMKRVVIPLVSEGGVQHQQITMTISNASYSLPAARPPPRHLSSPRSHKYQQRHLFFSLEHLSAGGL